LIASAVDRLSMLVWMQSKDGRRNTNRPESIAEKLIGGEEKQKTVESFVSPEKFEAARKRIMEGR